MANFKPLQTAFSRLFLIEGRARADHAPSFLSCMKMGGISKDYGDIEKIECPDPGEYGKFIEVGKIRGASGRVTATITGRFAADVASELARMAEQGCPIDLQVHIGACTDPSIFNVFSKNVIFEDVSLINYSTEDLGALSSDEQAKVDESADISAAKFYEDLPLTFAERAKDIVTNELLDVVICDKLSCGDCDIPSTGCNHIYALSTAAGGSPSTPADVVYSLDGGENWYTSDIDSLLTAEVPSAIACIGEYVVVVSNASNSLHYVKKADLDATGDETWTEVTTGFVAGGEPNDIWSVGNKAIIVGDQGYIYQCTDPTAGVTVIDAGVAQQDTYYAVHGINEYFWVACGQSGVLAKTENGTSWVGLATTPGGIGVNLNTVWVKTEKEWFIGTSNGYLVYTEDGGVHWTIKAFPGSSAGVVRNIAFATDSIGYLAHSTAAAKGRILRTWDGGYSWVVMPENTAQLPDNDYVKALAACDLDANLVVGVGLAGNATDGFLVVGKD